MGNKLSFSKISCYSLCGERFRLRYIERKTERFTRASLLFGSAIDTALNSLLKDRNLEEAIKVFNKTWNFQYINGKYRSLLDNPDVVFADRDLDKDLIVLTEDDLLWVEEFKEYKKSKKWHEISEEDRIKYNNICWHSLKEKGLIILDSYHKKILPEFLEVKGIQHEAELVNDAGDSVIQYLDFIVIQKDGSVVLMDNKTTSSMSYYDEDSPNTSQQLLSYFYNNKEHFGLEYIGFVVILKDIIKNKVKTCHSCGAIAEEGSRHKTCSVELEPGNKKSRCNGEFSVTMTPEAAIKIIVAKPTEHAIDLVLSTFDEANFGIKNNFFPKNLTVCKNIYGSPCEFYSHCWKGDDSNLIKIEKKDEQKSTT